MKVAKINRKLRQITRLRAELGDFENPPEHILRPAKTRKGYSMRRVHFRTKIKWLIRWERECEELLVGGLENYQIEKEKENGIN